MSFFSTSPFLLIAIFLLDFILGDPISRFHPVVLMGKLLRFLEEKIFEPCCWNRLGGFVMFLCMAAISLVFSYALFALAHMVHPWLGFVFMALLGSAMLAYRSLIDHARDVSPRAEGDLGLMRRNIAKIVGRDTDKMDAKNCRRAAIESMAESLVDGILTPIFFFVLAGLPGMLVFKVISTMDSMVGYKNERYRKFGWAGARLDDSCNYIPARLCWLSMVLLSFVIPGANAKGARLIGRRDQHHLPGFNSGWPEAAMAGALNCRLVGPIWQGGQLTTDLWLGEAEAPEGGTIEHLRLAEKLVTSTTVLWVVAGALLLWLKGLI